MGGYGVQLAQRLRRRGRASRRGWVRMIKDLTVAVGPIVRCRASSSASPNTTRCGDQVATGAGQAAEPGRASSGIKYGLASAGQRGLSGNE